MLSSLTFLAAALLQVYSEPDAAKDVKSARQDVLSSSVPLLRALVEVGAAEQPSALDVLAVAPGKTAEWMKQANAHLVIVGTPEDGAVAKRVKGYTYGIDCGKKELFRLGFGRFCGDVGIVETAFNPWLYSDKVEDTEKSTLMVRLSGTTPRGVQLAVAAFRNGMNNGIILGDGAVRTETSILDLDPSPEPPPKALLDELGERKGLVYAGWTQCPAQEYRAYLDWGAPEEPRRIWRIKYLSGNSLDSASGVTWVNSPLPVAFGNAVTAAEFSSAAVASDVCSQIVRKKGGSTSFPYPSDEVDYGSGSIRIGTFGSFLLLDSRGGK